MKGNQHIDFDGLAAFINGEVSEEENLRWEVWVQESAENRKVYEQALKLLEPDPVPEEAHKSIPFKSSAAWSKVNERITEEEETSRPFLWIRYAAAVALVTMLMGYWVFNQYFADVTISQQGGIATYILPDSSKVVLKGRAAFTYNREYAKENRHIALDGEGYFDVVRDTTLQFEVETQRGLVAVLGTAFLVHESRDSLLVVVDRGVVEVSLKDNSGRALLEKNEAAVIRFSDSATREYKLEDTNGLYWANKRLSFRRAKLSDVLDELSEIFDIPIDYDSTRIANCQITAVFLDQTLEEMLENISLSLPVQYTISNDRVEISSNGCPTF